MKKIASCQKMLKFLITTTTRNSITKIHYHRKLSSNLSPNLLLKPRGGFLTPRAKNSKNDKNLQKNLKKIAKISIILCVCVCVCSTETYRS